MWVPDSYYAQGEGVERARHSSHDTRLPSPRPATLPVWMRRTWSIVVGGTPNQNKNLS